jgi:hypothetical protein
MNMHVSLQGATLVENFTTDETFVLHRSSIEIPSAMMTHIIPSTSNHQLKEQEIMPLNIVFQ